MFKVTTKTIVAAGIGAALFALLFMYVKVPSPVPETSFQTAYGLSAFFGALFGPIAAGLMAFIGHAISDAVQYGSPWWSWVIASGVASFIYGLAYKRTKVEEGVFRLERYSDLQPHPDHRQRDRLDRGCPRARHPHLCRTGQPGLHPGRSCRLMNSIAAGVIGTLLLVAYAATRTKKGSLSKKSLAQGNLMSV